MSTKADEPAGPEPIVSVVIVSVLATLSTELVMPPA